MRTQLSLIAGALSLTACASVPSLPSMPWSGNHEPAPPAAPATWRMAKIGETEELRLPLPPAYPETRQFSQIIRANYGALGGVVEASMSMSPEEVIIVLAAAQGPRFATIVWNASGVEVDKTLLAPPGMPAENILGDIFIAMWPLEIVAQSLPADCTIADTGSGGRTVTCAGAPLIEITPDPVRANRWNLRNHDLGYQLSITSVE